MVKIKGTVSSSGFYSGSIFLKVSQPSQIDVIVFGKNVSVSEGETVEVIDKQEEYNKKTEIIAHRIRVIND
jgi:hypothetical protein